MTSACTPAGSPARPPQTRHAGLGPRARGLLAGGLFAIGAALAAVPAAAVVTPPPAKAQPNAATAGARGMPATVTLITGDKVRLDTNGNVRSIEPGPGRRSILFTQSRTRGELSVLPSDAAPLVRNGIVDPRLFNVSLLLQYGYDDAKRPTVPTIARGFDGGAGAMRAAGMQAPRTLNVLRGFSGAVDKRRTQAFWNLVKQRGAGVSRTTRFGARLWLDGRRQPLLDQSVPQVGGPVAWAAGYTGRGVTVAVLDSGIDAAHPDFAGRIVASANFSDEPDVSDLAGHGTHVASTIAGSGAASGGKYRGVAPDASLAIGKVCEQYGCLESAILAGMQWAAEAQRARVINMSLGGFGAPGIDPLEEAVDTLSATTGALFVIAAGNDGCASAGTVSSPATADASLAVGAVDRAGQMAPFSGCGPRQGDGAVKPEITAPGVDIVAARASTGTYPPVDPGGFYAALSGTSMATPHVAGAAALLAQQHPTLSGAELKGLLIATADPSNSASLYSQGAGLMNVGRAVQRSWFEAAGNASFGIQLWPHADDALLVRRLTLRNTGTKPVNLTLSVQATSVGGTKAPPGMFYLSANQVSVPAGGSTSVDLTADTRVAVPDDTYAGTVTVSDGATDSTTLFSVLKEVESYTLTLWHVGAAGAPTNAFQTYVDRLDANQQYSSFDTQVEDGKLKMRLPKGRYRLFSSFDTPERADVLGLPSLNFDKDLGVTIDARRAAPWQITLPDAQTKPWIRYFEAANWHLPFGMSGINGYTFDPAKTLAFGRISVPGVSNAAEDFAFNATSEMVRFDADGAPDSNFPVVFVAESARGAMPVGLKRSYGPHNLARVTNVLPPANAKGQTVHGLRPEIDGSAGGISAFLLPDARNRLEYYVNAGPYLRWAHGVDWQGATGYNRLSLESPAVTYAPGSRNTVDWTAPRPFSTALDSSFVVFDFGATPDLVYGSPGSKMGAALRRGRGDGEDVIAFATQPLGDAAGNAGTLTSDTPNSVVVSLRRGSTLLHQEDTTFYIGALMRIPAESGTYTLTMDTTTPPPMLGVLGLPTRSTTEWTFASQPASPDAWTTLPMSVVHLGKLARNPAGGWQIPLQVWRQATGEPVPDDLRSLSVELSTDGGSTWRSARLSGTGSQWSAAVPLAAFASRSLSVRSVAVSKDGAQVKQTVLGAYSAAALR